MARTRKELDYDLRQFLVANGVDSKNIYFEPPSNTILHYPCIIYNRSDIQSFEADNMKYVVNKKYTITIISNDPDDSLPDNFFTSFRHVSFDREYDADNLHHTVFDLFY